MTSYLPKSKASNWPELALFPPMAGCCGWSKISLSPYPFWCITPARLCKWQNTKMMRACVLTVVSDLWQFFWELPRVSNQWTLSSPWGGGWSSSERSWNSWSSYERWTCAHTHTHTFSHQIHQLLLRMCHIYIGYLCVMFRTLRADWRLCFLKILVPRSWMGWCSVI